MNSYIIDGGHTLSGEVTVSGAKNAALPLIAAALLSKEEVILHNCPRIQDVRAMIGILQKLGAEADFSGNTLRICADQLRTHMMPEELSHKIRSSFFMLGSVLGRLKMATFTYPGGCAIGKRPVDIHLNSLKKMGVTIREQDSLIHCTCRALRGNRITLPYPSVGATENTMLAAVLAEGETVLYNAAREPEIVDLMEMLCSMGARIEGAGTSCIRIKGVKSLHGTEYTCMPDRIEAGTFLCAVAATGGSIHLKGCDPTHISVLSDMLSLSGASVRSSQRGLFLSVSGRLKGYSATTLPYPAFPTDLQPQLCAAACYAKGMSRITETVFENRMRHVEQLNRAGAKISLIGQSAYIEGVRSLRPMEYHAEDLRGGAAFLIAALATPGRSIVTGRNFVERGYEDLPQKIRSLGGRIYIS